jgi:predicted small lipoprotein YifL
MKKLLLSILILLYLTSCGVKGDLYLPPENKTEQ